MATNLCGLLFSAINCSYVFYTPPNPARLRFLTLQPISITAAKPVDKHRSSQLRAIHRLEESDLEKRKLPDSVEFRLDVAVQAINQCFQLRKRSRGDSAVTTSRSGTVSESPKMTHAQPDWKALTTFVQISATGKSRPTLIFIALSDECFTHGTARQLWLRYTQLRHAPTKWQCLKRDLKGDQSLLDVSVRYVQ